jgi:hypothetical protein
VLPSLCILPLYTFLVCFLLKEGGEKEGESKNKQTYLLCFLKKEEEGGGESRRRRSAREAPPFARVFKTDPTLVIYKILEKTLVL